MKHTLKYFDRTGINTIDMTLINISVISRIEKSRNMLRLVTTDYLKEDYIQELTALRHLKRRSFSLTPKS